MPDLFNSVETERRTPVRVVMVLFVAGMIVIVAMGISAGWSYVPPPPTPIRK